MALVATATAAVGLTWSTARAVAPTFTTVPTRLYMVPDEHTSTLPAELAGLVIPTSSMFFDDVPTPDVISRQSRIITVNSTETSDCQHEDPDPADFSLTGCTTVKVTVNPTEGILRFVPDPIAEDDPRFPASNPRIQMYRFASGALLQDADDPSDFEGGTLSLIGTAAQINDTLKTLRFTPTVDDAGTANVDEDYYYTGIPGEGELEVAATNIDGSTTATVQIRVLDYNNFPAVEVPQDQWTITDPNSGADVPLFSPDDGNPPANPSLTVADEDNDEVADPAQPGGDDPDDGAGDEFLVIAWATCGKISLISSNGFDIGDDLEHVFDYVYDQFGDPLASDPADREMLTEALLAVIPDDVEQLPFANTDPASPTKALVAVADNINDVNYNLGRITFHPVDDADVPLQNTTCQVRVLISDLGNNGLPIQYIGDPPSGLEIPMFGVDFDTNYVPTVEQLTIQIGDGGDATPTITSVSDVTQAEGNGGPGATPFTFTVTLDGPAAGGETVQVSTSHSNGSIVTDLTDDADFSPLSNQTVTFAAGATSATFTVPVNGDLTDEDDENFELLLSNPVGLTIGDAVGLGTVQDDDPAPGLQITSFTDVIVPEGDAASTPFTFMIGLSDPAPPGGVSVRVSTNHVTTDVADLTPLSNQLVIFPEGATSRTVTVSVAGDLAVEPTETFTATLSDPVGASITAAAQSATGTITNDDFRHVSINDVTLGEGDAGTTSFTFTLTLDGPAIGNESVLVSTGGGSAVAGVDYTSLNNVAVTFGPGTLTQTVTVLVTGDTVVEQPDDVFLVSLSSPANLVVDDGIGVGTIDDDDVALPNASINDVTKAEGNAGTTDFTFTVSLDVPASAPASVDVATSIGTATAADFVTLPTTTVSFAIGEQAKPVTVQVNGDTDEELDEAFVVNLTNPQGLAIGDSQGVGTIQNDDGALTEEMVTIADVSQTEGDAGTTAFTFTLSLNGAAEGTESVTATVTHGSTNGADLTIVSPTVSFANGLDTATFDVDVNGDTTSELDETFVVTLSAPVGLIISDNTATGTIENDDRRIVSISQPSLAEGDGATTAFVFTVTLDGPAFGDESATLTPSHSTTDDTDLTLTDVPVTFAPGAMSTTATVLVNGDTTVEADEAFVITLSNVMGLDPTSVVASSAAVLNDDGVPAPPQIVTVSNVSMDEGDAGTTAFQFVLTLDQAASGDESVQVSTVHVTTDGVDLMPLANQTVTFAASATTVTATVLVNGDPDVEPDETFTLTLGNAQNVAIAAAAQSATGTILDDDAVVQPPTPLTITVPNDIVVPNDPGQPGAVVAYPAPTTNGGVLPVTITCSSPSGGFFPIGVTTVTCTATDSAPNQQQQQALAIVSGSFTITVVETTPPTEPTTPPTVTPPAPTTGVTAPNLGELPATGGDSSAPLAIAAVACALGGLLLLVRRRSRPAS